MSGTTSEKLFYAVAGSRLTNADAQIIGSELSKLGSPTAQEIVDSARNEESPLHRYFEWDDSIAAEEYRKDQARYLARSIVVREGPKEDPIRAFPAIPVVRMNHGEEDFRSEWGTPQRYTPIDVVRNDSSLSQHVLDDAKRQLIAWKRKFETYRDVYKFKERFEPVFLAIDELDGDQ